MSAGAGPCGFSAYHTYDSGTHISSKSFLPGELAPVCAEAGTGTGTAAGGGNLSAAAAAVMSAAANHTDVQANFTAYEDYTFDVDVGTPSASRIWIYGAPVIIILGLIGNTLSMIVMRRPSLSKMTASTYLTVLAGADTMVLLLGLLRFWIIEMFQIDFRTLNVVTCKLHTSVIYFCFHFEAWLLVSVTFERYIAVCRPIHYQVIFTRRRVIVGLIVTAVVFAVINSHFLWTYNLTIVGTVRYCYFDEFAMYFIMHVWPWFDLILASLLPFGLMLYMNATISYNLLARRHKRRTSTAKRDDNTTAMTVMLLFVTFVFVLLSLPYCIYFVMIKGLVMDATKYVPEDQEKVHLIHACTSLIAYSNYAINFLLYCIGGKRFRRELHSLVNDIAANCGSRAESDHVNMMETFNKNLHNEESTRCQLEESTKVGLHAESSEEAMATSRC